MILSDDSTNESNLSLPSQIKVLLKRSDIQPKIHPTWATQRFGSARRTSAPPPYFIAKKCF